MSDIAIKVENVSKQYRLGEVGTGTISHDLNRWWARIRGKEDPFLKIGESNDRSTKGTSDYVWALKDINFEVKKGEVLGIIGKNGAGKSTLLKILSKVTGPTTGEIKGFGRIASLLEVGTGFHPELTGRENIYLNGTILGMTKMEVSKKLDEIVDFAGVERYLDTPVKRYSSGMMVRLGFAVAAHLEPEILIVDEVLAVGDAEFQKKAIGKMQEVSSGEGRTVLFVSHNMGSIRKLCKQILVLENGKKCYIGKVDDGIQSYLMPKNNSKVNIFDYKEDSVLKWLSFQILQKDSKTDVVYNGFSTLIEIRFEILEESPNFRLYCYLETELGIKIFKSYCIEKMHNGMYIGKASYLATFKIPSDVLIEGTYFVKIHADLHQIRPIEPRNGISLELKVIEAGKFFRKNNPTQWKGIITFDLNWTLEKQ